MIVDALASDPGADYPFPAFRGGRMGVTKIIGWGVFTVLVAAAAYLGLRACVLTLPLVGPVISRCPTMTYADMSDNLNAETQALLDQLEDLQFAAAGSNQCPAIPPGIENADIPEAEQVVIILDTSGSMADPVAPSPRYEDINSRLAKDLNAHDLLRTGVQSALATQQMQTIEQRIKAYQQQLDQEAGAAPRRMTEAKRAIRGVLEDPPGGKPVSLWGFGECNAPPNKLFPAPMKSAAAVIDGITPYNGTPLADTIGYVGQMLEAGAGQTEERGVNVVIFSDGANSCGVSSDPCEAARKVKETHPYVWMHVVNLAPNLEVLSCVAKESGGVQVDGNNSNELTRILRYVAQAG
mgnify:CR=1 FL=1|jgi:hypothetical protein